MVAQTVTLASHTGVLSQPAPPGKATSEVPWNSNQRLRVLHFASVINRHDFIDTIIGHIDKRRFALMACTFSWNSNIQATEYDETIPSFSLNVNGRRDYPGAIFRLAAILREQKVDILHAHHYDEALIGSAAAAMVAKCRLVVGRHYYDEIYLLSRSVKRYAYLAFEKFINRSANAIVVPSSVIRSMMSDRQHVPEEKISIIPYGFEFEVDKYSHHTSVEMENVLSEFGIPKGRFVFGNFGRHHKLKGQEALLRSYASFVNKYSDTTLLMVGDGPNGSCLRALAGKLGLVASGMVVFAGWRKDAWRILEAVDVVVHPSLHESLSQLMVEAMAKAKPLIITNVAGPCDHARHLENAYVIEEPTDQSIYDALAWMYNNRAAAQVLARNASSYVRSELPIERIIPRFEALYERVAC